jgi:plastocyanin
MKKLTIIVSGLVAVMLLSTSASATKWIITVQNFSFSPSNLPGVIVGDTVRWNWINGSHTTTSTTIPAGAASWDHPLNSSNTFFEYKVTVAGSYNYKCTPHEGMGMVGSFTATALTPVLVSISPNQALQGSSFMATIIGSNTNFNGSPAVSLTYSNNPGETITASSVIVISPTVLHAQFTIPGSASPGLWNLHVNSLTLPNSFTVIEVVPAITFMTPNIAHQGDSFNGTVFGQNTTWTGTPSVYLSNGNNPSEVINGSNVVVVSNTELTADFTIPADASTGNYTIHVDALDQANAFTVLAALVPALSGISPDNGKQGELVPTTITAENTSFVGGNHSVFLSLHVNSSETIQAANVVIVNNTTLTADFDIPYMATPGLWDLHVDVLELQNAFTVIDVVPSLVSIVPDSANQGEQLTSVITAVDSRFMMMPPAVSLSLSSDPAVTISASSVNVLSDVQVEAVFNIPPAATVGSWDVHVDEMILIQGFTVNLFTGINDPLAIGVRIYPNPADEQFFIENAAGAYVSVFNTEGTNIMGQRITSDKQAVDINRLSPGVYIIRIKSGESVSTSRIIKN